MSIIVKRIKNSNDILRMVFLAVLSMGMFGACNEEELTIKDNNADDEDAIRVKAGIFATENATRTYYGSDEVETVSDGIFYMTYPRNEANKSYTSCQYDMATVTFGHPEDPTTGYVSYEKNGKVKDLKWLSVSAEGRSQVYLFLHNINPEWFTYVYPTSNTYSNQKYSFNNNAPYLASPLDKENGTNDLISSGYSSLTSTGYVYGSASNNIIFPLFHRMALFKLNIEVYDAGDGHIVDLRNARVTLTNLYTKLASFNLYYPYNFSKDNSSNYGQYTTREDIVLVGDVDDNTHYGWETIKENPEYTNSQGEKVRQDIYSVQDFVIPPQTIVSGYKPQVIVKVPKEDVTGSDSDKGSFIEYKGTIPDYMYAADASGNITSQNPIATSFTSGYALHVTATINSPETEMSFAPVTVEQWVSKGGFIIRTNQSGIYDESDFMALMDAYNTDNTYAMEQYGFKSGDTYVFQFWNSITLDYDKISKKIVYNSNFPFVFLLNDYTVTIQNGDNEPEDLTGNKGQNRLYEIVTGDKSEFYTGIQNDADMAEFLSLMHRTEENSSPNTAALMKYGHFNGYDGTWFFELKNNVSASITDLFQAIDPTFLGGEFNFDYNGHTITVTAGNEDILVCEADQEYSYFDRLALVTTTTYGIYSSDDFYLLTDCYNKFYPYREDVLKLFGTQSSNGKWTLYFRSAMTLEGSRAFLSMRPDPDNNRPTYSFSSSGSSSITFTDDKTPFTASSSTYYYPAISGTGAATNNTLLNSSTLPTYYNNKDYQYLWFYGRYENGKWIFPLTYSEKGQYGIYSNLFGKMIPDETAGKYDYEFYLGETIYNLRNFPQSQGGSAGSSTTYYRYFTQDGSPEYNYPNSAADLTRVGKGTYWEIDDNQP